MRFFACVTSFVTTGLLLSAALAIAADTVPASKDSVEPTFLSNVRQVTSDYEKAGEGYFSPDGKSIVFQAIRAGYPFYQIYTRPLSGGDAKLISTGRGRTTCAYFSPNGERILFASSHLDPNLDATEAAERKQQEEDRKSGVRRRYSWPFDPHTDIFEADRDGHILRRLTDAPGYDAEGAYSADGKRIAYCHDDGTAEKPDPNIWVMNTDGSDKRQLTDAPGYDGGPFISPDGNWIVFRSDRQEEHLLQIYVIGIDGKNETALTDNQGVNWGPYWHPTQPYIIWSGADHSDPTARPNYDLWMMRYAVDDGQFKMVKKWRVTDSPAADVLPVFSPDGSKLMWTSTRTDDHSSQLFIADFQLPK